VRVFNGSGQSGLATKVGTDLNKEGFVIPGVGNKPAVKVTQVRYRPGSQSKAAVVQSYLGGVGKLIEDRTIVEADVAVVLGNDFKAVAAPGGAGAPTSAPAPTPTPAPAPSAPGPSAGPNGKQGGPPPDPTQC
jgi:hypothetical protein